MRRFTSWFTVSVKPCRFWREQKRKKQLSLSDNCLIFSVLLVIRVGLEPTTPTLKVLCSTSWASESPLCLFKSAFGRRSPEKRCKVKDFFFIIQILKQKKWLSQIREPTPYTLHPTPAYHHHSQPARAKLSIHCFIMRPAIFDCGQMILRIPAWKKALEKKLLGS